MSSDDEELPNIEESKGEDKSTKDQSLDDSVPVLSTEVDFKTFCLKFWPYQKKFSERIKPITAWTEIYSVIKGNTKSHTYIKNCMPEEIYVHQS